METLPSGKRQPYLKVLFLLMVWKVFTKIKKLKNKINDDIYNRGKEKIKFMLNVDQCLVMLERNPTNYHQTKRMLNKLEYGMVQ